jgi:hypothetical protein
MFEFVIPIAFCKICPEVNLTLRSIGMTNDELRKTMEFIVEQQAHFAANIQRLQEEHQRLQEEHQRDRPRLARLEESFQLLVELAKTSDERMDSSETFLNTIEIHLTKLETNMAVLAESQAHSDARLSALIDIVREDRNGRS